MIRRIVIIGYGSIGKRHLRIARETIPDAEILVLRHQHTTDIPEFADYVSASVQEVLDFCPQIVVVANPAPFHLKYAEALLATDCHFLIEKPIAVESKGVKEFLDQVHMAKRVCQVGYNLRFVPSLIAFRRLIHEGVIGRPMAIRCEIGQYLPDWRPGTDYRDGVSARREMGGGVLLELSHEIDYLRWIFGEVEWVSAWIGHLSDFDIDVEDTAYITLGFQSMRGTKEVVASLMMDFIRCDATRTCTVIGNEGTLHWNGLTGTVEQFTPGAQGWIEVVHHPHGRDDSYRAQWAHFLHCVQLGDRPLADGDAGLAVLNVVEAAKQSAQQQGNRQEIAK